ncbi:MAG: hypothetical protein ACHQNT_10145 [Bacteroidia bacterium]
MKNILFVIVFLFAAVIISCNNENEKTSDTSSSPDSIIQPVKAEEYTANPSSQSDAQVNASSPTQQSTVPVVTSAPAPQNSGQMQTTTAPGMNPPHGEPGHRCEIPVGAPLNSAPAAQTTQPSISPPTTMQPATAPPITAQPQAGTTAPGMNPPHGEPGHDCAIPVGAPLKK